MLAQMAPHGLSIDRKVGNVQKGRNLAIKVSSSDVLKFIKKGTNSDLKNVMINSITWFVCRQRTQDYAAKTDYMNGPTRREIILFSIYVIINCYTYININILYSNYYTYISNVFYLNYLFVFAFSVSA